MGESEKIFLLVDLKQKVSALGAGSVEAQIGGGVGVGVGCADRITKGRRNPVLILFTVLVLALLEELCHLQERLHKPDRLTIPGTVSCLGN